MLPMAERSSRAIARIDRHVAADADARSLRLALLEEVGRHVGFDAYAWLLTDPETAVGSDPLADVPCLPELPRLIRLKYSTTTNRWTNMTSPVGLLHAVTDGHLDRSLLWREMLSGYDVGDVASVAFRDRFGCWGFLDLWRTGRHTTFSDADAEYLSTIAGKVTEMLRLCQARTFSPDTPIELPSGPAVLILSPDLHVRAQTADTHSYLRALMPTEEDRQPVPAAAYNVAAQLLAVEAEASDRPPPARVHLGGARWLTLRAARMAGADQSRADIAVTIETSSGFERVDLFSRSHGLSPRESELMAALARGSDTRQLASELYLSENTVQDHLKSIFAKTGSRSRRSLLARALGS
jgi:DNA-binding CsgD family transcriptional regulator